MRSLVFIALLIVIMVFDFCLCQSNQQSGPSEEELVEYLRTHWKSPEDYVLEKFARYDIVFLGEFHWVKHDVEFVQRLIPRLHAIGVYDLGIEFGSHELQDMVDSLLVTETYDEALVRRLFLKFFVSWGYKEYMDIFRVAWHLNRSLPPGVPKFRVVNLNYSPKWNMLKETITPELWKLVWYKGDLDQHEADVISQEFLGHGKKALIYSGNHHALTGYYQPIYDFNEKKLKGFRKNRMGNIINNRLPGKTFHIVLHHPWMSKTSPEELVDPVGGNSDNVMKKFKDKRVGFDVKGSSFGRLTDTQAYYSIGYDGFTLSSFCDGYIFQRQLEDYDACTVDTLFVTGENLREAIENIPDLKDRENYLTPEDFIKKIRSQADIRKIFSHMK